MSADNRLPELPRELHSSVADHQVLLSFNGDDDALAWVEWWETEGYKAYLETVS